MWPLIGALFLALLGYGLVGLGPALLLLRGPRRRRPVWRWLPPSASCSPAWRSATSPVPTSGGPLGARGLLGRATVHGLPDYLVVERATARRRGLRRLVVAGNGSLDVVRVEDTAEVRAYLKDRGWGR
jgi:hypothetical protein